MKNRLPSFKHAFSGIAYVLKTQKNAWIHLAATIFVILLALILRLSLLHLGILVLVIGLVWAAEIFNTSIESVVDLISPNHHPLAKIAKDASAAAVLVASIISIVIGILLLGPALLSALKILFTR